MKAAKQLPGLVYALRAYARQPGRHVAIAGERCEALFEQSAEVCGIRPARAAAQRHQFDRLGCAANDAALQAKRQEADASAAQEARPGRPADSGFEQ